MRVRFSFGEGITAGRSSTASPCSRTRRTWIRGFASCPARRSTRRPSSPCRSSRGRLKGTVNIYRVGEDASFSDEEFLLATRFGDAAALALDNAHIRARLEHQASTDALTGLFNHRAFHDRLRAEVIRASTAHSTVGLVMVDLDDFKRVNDVYGHGIGDQLLQQVAYVLRRGARS